MFVELKYKDNKPRTKSVCGIKRHAAGTRTFVILEIAHLKTLEQSSKVFLQVRSFRPDWWTRTMNLRSIQVYFIRNETGRNKESSTVFAATQDTVAITKNDTRRPTTWTFLKRKANWISRKAHRQNCATYIFRPSKILNNTTDTNMETFKTIIAFQIRENTTHKSWPSQSSQAKRITPGNCLGVQLDQVLPSLTTGDQVFLARSFPGQKPVFHLTHLHSFKSEK